MGLEFVKTEFDGLYIIRSHIYEDFRGEYEKHYEANAFRKMGLREMFTESSDLYTKKGAIRGLHYQVREEQAKLVRVVCGKTFDVAVDMRRDSKTFLKHFSIVLSGDDGIGVYIPEGFAHGFLALEDNTIFSYHSSGKYMPEYCGGLRWDDPKLNIKWPIEEYYIRELLITEKDKNWELL